MDQDKANTEHVFADTNRHMVEVPETFAIARWPRDADVATIARCILGTLKYEPHTADTTALRRALESVIANNPPSMATAQQKDLRQREGTFTTCSTVAISITYRDKSVARIFATSALGRFLNWIAWNAGHDFASSGGPSRVPTYQLREQLGP
jgi:hypothetical protein